MLTSGLHLNRNVQGWTQAGLGQGKEDYETPGVPPSTLESTKPGSPEGKACRIGNGPREGPHS